MADKAKAEDYVAVCPKCGSDNVTFDRNPAYIVSGLINQFMQCNNCDHHAQVFPEVMRSKLKGVAKKVDKVEGRQFINLSFAKGYLKYLLYVVIPTLVLLFILSSLIKQ